MVRTLSIRIILTLGFGGLLAAGIAASLYVGLSTAFHNTRDLLSENVEGLVERIEEEVDLRLTPIERQARAISDRVAAGALDLRNPYNPETSAFFEGIVSALPQVSAAGLIGADGRAWGWLQGGGKFPISDYSDQPGVMEWVETGRDDPVPDWGPPFWLDELEDAVIIHETAIFDGQEYLGYLTFIVPISGFSRSLAKITPNSFLLYGKDDVLAHPLMIGWRPLEGEAPPEAGAIYNGSSALMPLSELGDPVLERLWTAEHQDLVLLRGMEHTKAVASQIGDVQYIYMYRTLEGYGPEPLYVGTYLNAHQEGETVTRLFYAVIAGGIVLAMATVASLYLSHHIRQPIEALARAARAVREDRIGNAPTFPRSRITELSGAMASFANMVEGLAERDRIRATLGRYVPERVAQQLMSGEGGLKPVESEATILFCDIAGFTALTEKLGPARIVEVLNAYFSAMTRIIEGRGGVVTQFQGDAILAIFNTPIPAPDHASQACRAAIEMAHAIARDSFAGETLKARIGVNTGPIVAGAVGAEDRLTYTVHGDAVNLAARIEALNKALGTTVLVTEATAKLAAGVTLEKAGSVEIRGHAGAVTVFAPAQG